MHGYGRYYTLHDLEVGEIFIWRNDLTLNFSRYVSNKFIITEFKDD